MASRRTRSNTSKPPRAAAVATVSDLPEAAVAAILRHVPLKQRLSSCALVCRAWAAAAAAASSDVTVQLRSDQQSRQLQDWLAQHGGVVVALDVHGYSYTYMGWRPLQFPVTRFLQLRRLDLSFLRLQSLAAVATRSSTRRQRCSVTGGSNGGTVASSSGGSAALPQLQELRLLKCRLTLQSASQLLSATALSKLHLQGLTLVNDNWTRSVPDEKVMPTLWQQLALLPNLSELSLQYVWTAAGIAPVSTLQHLQTLSVMVSAAAAAAAVAAAPTSLSALCLRVGYGHQQEAAAVDRLRSLQQFEGVRVHMQPSSLCTLTGLQHLKLVSPVYPGPPEDGARELLAALGTLTQLRDLDCSNCQLHLFVAAERFTSLTASSHLTSLRIEGYGGMPVPQGAVDHMFAPGKVLPHLIRLRLWCARVPDPAHSHLHPCVRAAQVARIAASCPALTEVMLWNVAPVGFDRSCLLQLPAGVTRVEGLPGWSRPAS